MTPDRAGDIINTIIIIYYCYSVIYITYLFMLIMKGRVRAAPAPFAALGCVFITKIIVIFIIIVCRSPKALALSCEYLDFVY